MADAPLVVFVVGIVAGGALVLIGVWFGYRFGEGHALGLSVAEVVGLTEGAE